MKNSIRLLLLAFLGGCAVHAHIDVDTGDGDRAAIQKVRSQFESAMQTGNPDAAVEVFDADVVVMSPDHAAYEGIDAARQWAVKDLAQTHSGMSFEVDELELAGDWAIERGTYWKGAGKRIWVYRRQDDGSWRIKYIMWGANSAQ